MKRILFVCTGNTCRSPLAEGLGRKMAAEQHLELEFRSAGVAAMDGQNISQHSALILQEHGVEDQLYSSMITDELVHWADLILTMTGSHKQLVISSFPQAIDKVFTLKEYTEDDIDREQITENERKMADLQMKLSLEQDEKTLDEIAQQLQRLSIEKPDHDISDPFGQDLTQYRYCAEEIKHCLEKLIHKQSG